MGSYVSELCQKLNFCKISGDSGTHVFLSVLQPQTLKIYDVIDSSDTSIMSNFETLFVV